MRDANLHRWFAREYSRAERDHERAAESGNRDRIDETLSRKQELERGVSIHVHNPELFKRG